MSETRTALCDTVIIGGGVAALWTANELRAAGQSVAVLTNTALGTGQTLAAQGVIHGGVKYAVAGKLTDSSEALAAMPGHWLAALHGEGPVDLRGAELLSDHQILWSLPNVVSQVVSFFGSKALRGRSAAIAREDYPAVFDTPDYKGRLFRIDEPVVDPVSVVRELARGVAGTTWEVDWEKNAKLITDEDGISAIEISQTNGTTCRLEGGNYVLAAGSGNGPLLAQLGIAEPRQQLRPLHQLVIRREGLPPFFSVCVGTGPKPPVVVTTHRDSAGRTLWYVGGDLAEQAGVERGESDQIEAGRTFFSKWLPWIDLSEAEWFTCRVDRAEPLTGTGDRPPGAYCHRHGNVLVTWPTKLALAPALAEEVLLETVGDRSGGPVNLDLPRPGLGKPPWDLP